MAMIDALARGGDFPFLALLLPLAVIVIVVSLSVAKTRAMNRAVMAVALRVGGTAEEGGWFSEPTLNFKVRGRNVSLEVFAGSKNRSPYTRFVVDLVGVSPGSMTLQREGFAQSFLRMFGAQDLSVGDEAFDADYVVKANPPGLVGRIFSQGRRRQVMTTVRSLREFRGATIDLTLQGLQVKVFDWVDDEARMVRIIEATREFVDYVLDGDPEAGIRWVPETVSGSGVCQVCGTELRDAIVRCVSCRTPHHQECWEYAGRCSTYACGQRRFEGQK